MFAAQSLVDQWLHSVKRQPFRRAVDSEEIRIWDGHAGYEGERRTFRQMTETIRLGQGHARSNPGPLLKIAAKLHEPIPG